MRLKGWNGCAVQGDTIIEVMFAITVFAVVAVGAITIMNRSMATAERALEITLVREQLDAQAEAIRYIHQVYVDGYPYIGSAPTGVAALWPKLTGTQSGQLGADTPSSFGVTGQSCPNKAPGQHPFLLNAQVPGIYSTNPAMQVPAGQSLPPYAQVIYDPTDTTHQNITAAYGLWVEAVPSKADGSNTGFVDFHIRACWPGAGESAPMTLGTIVRLYEPR